MLIMTYINGIFIYHNPINYAAQDRQAIAWQLDWSDLMREDFACYVFFEGWMYRIDVHKAASDDDNDNYDQTCSLEHVLMNTPLFIRTCSNEHGWS